MEALYSGVKRFGCQVARGAERKRNVNHLEELGMFFLRGINTVLNREKSATEKVHN